MELNELRTLQALPLEIKIEKSKKRIREWFEYYGRESIYASFSGGIGSTTLYYLIKEIENEDGVDEGQRIPFLFVNTRNEYPEVVKHVYRLKGQNNEKYRKIMKDVYNDVRNVGDTIDIRLPKEKQQDVIKKYGYLVYSKKVSRNIMDQQRLIEKYPSTYDSHPRYLSRLNIKNRHSVPKKYQYLIHAPFKISNACCRVLKHSVFHTYERETGRLYPLTGEQASESQDRTRSYLKFGCNGYNRKKPKGTPLGFWTSHDLLDFIKQRNIPYPSCYGDIIMGSDGKYHTTKEQRTGCMCCMAGISSESGENRFQRMSRDYPMHYQYLMRPLNKNGLGAKEILSYLNIETEEREVLTLEELINLYC